MKKCLLVILIVLLGLFSCKKDARRIEAELIVKEWVGKEIRFPDNVPCYVSGRDTLPKLCDEGFQKEFKILLYVDSTGCSSCRLNLLEWGQLMKEADSLFQEKVGFLLFFQPKNMNEMKFLFIRDWFDYPVFMDINGAINQLNRFPQSMKYQCFLLDKNNRVLMIGNPVLNLKIWELYKEQIAGEKQTDAETITTVELDKTVHEYGNIRKGSTNSAVFAMTNTGRFPLVIQRVSVSCGCASAD